MAANGLESKRGKALPGGIYVPTATFFKDTPGQELDLETFTKHMEWLARAGVHGVTVQGSTGEAALLTREERITLLRIAKEAFARVGNPGLIIAGTVGAQSTWENVQLAKDAASAGSDYILTLPPNYYAPAMSPAAIQAFYEDLADQSPLPVLIYSYPAVSSGLNMDSDLIMRLAKHPNIVGVKHTDHDVGRIAREARIKDYGTPFTVLGGATDYLLGTLAYGGKGAITGIANVAPRVCLKVYELALAGKAQEAAQLAGELSKGEWVMGRNNILGTKLAIQIANNYPESARYGRKPIPRAIPDDNRAHTESEIPPLAQIERGLEAEGFVGQILRPATVTKAQANGHAESNGSDGLLDKIKQKVAAL